MMAEIRDFEMFYRIYASRSSPTGYQPLHESLIQYDGVWREQMMMMMISPDDSFKASKTTCRIHSHVYDERNDGIFRLEL